MRVLTASVDRSTISKIILSAHRWTQPQEPLVPAAPKQLKTVGGRFPAIEEKMHEWMDQQIAAGLDVRDNIARDKAKAFAREIGFPMERFKASAKWLDKVSCHSRPDTVIMPDNPVQGQAEGRWKAYDFSNAHWLWLLPLHYRTLYRCIAHERRHDAVALSIRHDPLFI